jgi:AraC-like DNA-binding protein
MVKQTSGPELMGIRDAFLRKIGPASPIHRIFDLIPNVLFFAKDRHFRIMAASRGFLRHLGLEHEWQVVGRHDFELFPPRLAENFRRDDELVIARGEPRLNIVELFFTVQGVPDLFVTDKLPLRASDGRVIGLMGMVRRHSHASDPPHSDSGSAAEAADITGDGRINKALGLIRRQFRLGVRVKELADAVNLSPRQLQRRFIEAFGMPPRDLILKLRVQAACELLLKGDASIAQVAAEVGFQDQGAFTVAFKKEMGTPPLRYRAQHRRCVD